MLPSNVAQESRPPLQGDMDIPSACTYSPMVKPPQMANSPAWSFGAKCHTDRGNYLLSLPSLYFVPPSTFS